MRACSYYHLQNLIVKQLLNILPADAAAAAATAAAAGTKKNLKPANLIRCSSAPATVAPRATAAKQNGAGGAGSGGAGGGGGGSKKLVPPPDVTFQEMLAKPGAIEMLKGHIGKEHAYLAPFLLKRINLPRQARDRHRESHSKKRCAFLQGSRQRRTSPLQSCSRWSATTTSSSRQPALARVVRTETFPSFLRHRILKNPNLCQDRLGTTREQLKRRNIFLQGLVVVVRMLTRMMYRARVMRNLTYRANCREAGAWRYRSATALLTTAVGTGSKPRSLLHVWAYYVATCCVGCVRVRVRVNALWMRCGQATVVDRRHGREAMDDSAWA